jgi:hypothetical protein
MGRRLIFFILGIALAVGGYFGYRRWSDPPEQPPAPIHELAVHSVNLSPVPATPAELLCRQMVAGLALAPGQAFPAILPWQPVVDIGEQQGRALEQLLTTDPVRFLELCAQRYDGAVQSYTCTFVKKERIDGKLYPPGKNDYEIIRVACREHPFSVHFDWKQHRKKAARALYVEGENDGKLLARPFITLMPVRAVALDDPDAAKSGRYPMSEFGIGLAIKRSVKSMQDAEARGALHLRYDGQVKLEELNGRVCHKFVRTPYEPMEEDVLNELTLYIDVEHWIQVGSILRDPKGNLLAEYFFRDLELNPEISARQFTKDSL